MISFESSCAGQIKDLGLPFSSVTAALRDYDLERWHDSSAILLIQQNKNSFLPQFAILIKARIQRYPFFTIRGDSRIVFPVFFVKNILFLLIPQEQE